MESSGLTATDSFCGGGGYTEGATMAGIKVELAINHWDLAIETHAANFPGIDHAIIDLMVVDPKIFPRTDVVIACPECTNHSISKGQKRKSKQMELIPMRKPTPDADRSRMKMWQVPRWAEVHRNDYFMFENVVDVIWWEDWEDWLKEWDKLGYVTQFVYLNSQIAWPTPQSRDRIYGIIRRKGTPHVDLDFRPWAHCPKCEKNVQAIQGFKPNRNWGKLGKQYNYVCPTCATVCALYYYPAASAIDWSRPIQKIGDRKKPLEEKTLARIRAGARKFGYMPGTLDLAYGSGTRYIPLNRPICAQTTRQTQGMVIPPFMLDTVHTPHEGRHEYMVWPIDGPRRTQLTSSTQGLVVPPYVVEMKGTSTAREMENPLSTVTMFPYHALVIPYYSTGVAHESNEPLPTVTANDRCGLALPPYLMSINHTTDRAYTIGDPSPVMMTEANPYIVTPPGQPWITAYYNRNNDPALSSTGIDEPLPVQAAQPRHYLTVQPDGELDLSEWGFRMLHPSEIKRAMGVRDDYIILGNQREQVHLLGNMVCPPMGFNLAKRLVQSIM